MAIWRIKTKSPIFLLANIFCTRLIQNLAHDLSVALWQWFKSSNHLYNIWRPCLQLLILSNSEHFHIVTMVMLKYAVKREARPSYKPSNLLRQNIEVAQKSDADSLVNQTIFAQALITIDKRLREKVWFTRLNADAINQHQTNLSGVGGQ